MAQQVLRTRFQGIAAVILWLTTIAHLSPLPPDEIAHYVELFEHSLAQPPMSLPNWNSRPEWEKDRTKEDWNNTSKEMLTFISDKTEEELVLCIKWWSRLILIAVALGGWLLVSIAGRIHRRLLVLTTALLLIGYAIFNSAVYSEFVRLWSTGRVVLPYIYWQFSALIYFHYFFVPGSLAWLTVSAFTKSAHIGKDKSAI
jgi:hypothetical protein